MTSKKWKIFKLAELYDFSSGLSKKKEEFGFGYEFLTFKDVFDNYFIPNELKALVNSNEKEREKCSIKKGDVFLTRTSETEDELGMSTVALKDYPNATFNGFTKRLRPKINNLILPEYAVFFFRSTQFRNQVTSMSTMTTRASLNNSMLAALEIIVPSIEEQKIIADILYSLNKKILLNNQINSTLEELATAIFKHWFVDFEFPNEDGKPYRSIGGEMVESELGMIPKGWTVRELGDVIEIHDSKRIPLSKNEREKREKIYPYYGAASLMDYVDEYIFEGVHVLMGEDGTVITDDGYPKLQYVWGKFWVNNHAHVLKGVKNVSDEFIYILLKHTNIKSIVTGAVQLKINQKNLKNKKVVLPKGNELIMEYAKLIGKNFDSIRNNSDEIERLKKIRDLLLPKLMSGEIRVPVEE